MKKGLLYYRIPVHTPDWHKMRTTGLTAQQAQAYDMPTYQGGIGASEIATIIGLSDKYRPVPQEIFHFKVGSLIPPKWDNAAAFHGRKLEPYVKDLWQCSDGTETGYIAIYEKWETAPAGEKSQHLTRRARKVNAVLINPDYKHLSVNLDYEAVQGAVCMMPEHSIYAQGEIVPGGFPLEIKTIGGMAARVWETGIPVEYVAQINQQMLVTGTKYAELALFELGDKRRFETYYFERNDELCNRIVVQGKIFWDKVLEARKIYAQIMAYNAEGNYTRDDELMSYITALEPPVDTNESYKDYYSERYQKEIEFMPGGEALYLMAKKHKFLTALIKKFTALKSLATNVMTEKFLANKVEKMIFDSEGKDYVRYYKKGAKFMLDNRVKFKPDDDDVQEEVDKVNLLI